MGDKGKTQTRWHVGYAECDITPPKGHVMSGYARERYSKGVILPLMAQVLAMRDARGNTALLVTADVLGFESPTIDLLRRHIAQRHGLPGPNLIVAASHTHWGPSLHVRVNWIGSGPNVVYLDTLEKRLIALIDEALSRMRPAELSYTSLKAQIGHNRRVPLANGTCDWGINPEGTYDTHTPVLSAHVKGSGQGPNRILVVGHACHPTSTGVTDRWTADYPGAMREHLCEAIGSGSRAMFVMGCGGDIKVTHRERGELRFSASPARSRAAGRHLANCVLQHLSSHKPVKLNSSLECHAEEGSFQLAPARTREQLRELWLDRGATALDRNWARQMLLVPDDRKRYDYEMTGWRLGGCLTLFGLPGEVCSPLGPRTRAAAGTEVCMVIGYANTVDAYIPDSRIVREGGYEGESAHRAWFLPAPFTEKIDREWDRLLQRTVMGLESAG